MPRKLKITEMGRMSVEEYRQSEKMPLVVVLDDVRSMYNVGSVFRTADAYRVTAIYLCGITACPPHVEIHKTALGAEDSVAWRYFSTAQEAVQQLHEEGFTVYAVEQAEGSIALQEFEPCGKTQGTNLCEPCGKTKGTNLCPIPGFAVVLGNEVKGVHQVVVDMCDACLELPQFGTKHSLNVSTTAGIVIWEMWKKLASLHLDL